MDTVHCTLYTVCTALINHMYRLNIHTESQNGRQYSFVFKFAHNYRRQWRVRQILVTDWLTIWITAGFVPVANDASKSDAKSVVRLHEVNVNNFAISEERTTLLRYKSEYLLNINPIY